MAGLGNVVESLIKAQKAARLLERYKENKEALRQPPARPGIDETGDSTLLRDLSDFVSKLEVDREKPTAKKVSLSIFRRQLKWLYDMIDEGQKTKKFRTTGNAFKAGRFYSFNYVPRNEEKLPIWDARPIILCLNDRYPTHYFNSKSKKPNIGILGVNWHYIKMRDRRRIMKQLIHDHSGNRIRFLNNHRLDISSIANLAGVYNVIGKNAKEGKGALRQYLRAGRYLTNGGLKPAGTFSVVQIPYSAVTEILEIPSIYEAAFVGGTP